jgi:hypothetical protein
MTTQDRDYEDALRRALAAAAESIEPTGDGLQRIRHRLDSPRSPRSVLSGCAQWLELHGTRVLIRLDPAIEAARTALRRTAPVSGPLVALASFLAGLFSPRGRRRAGGHRGPPSPPGPLGSPGAWLKPVFAVSAAVAIVVVGVVILNHETGTLVGPAGSYGTASPGASGRSGGTTANSKRWTLPLGVKIITGPAQSPKMSTKLPAVACTPTPSPAASTTAPAGGGTPTPTPTVSGTASATPTAQPTETTLPSPTPTASAASTGGTATATAAAMDVPYDAGAPAIVECGAGPEPSATP